MSSKYTKLNTHTFMGGRWRYKHLVSSKLTKIITLRSTIFYGGRWRYKLIVSLKLTKITIHKYTNLPAGVGVANL